MAAGGHYGGRHPDADRIALRERLKTALARAGLTYAGNGRLTRVGVHVAARQLNDLIRERNLPAIEAEFVTLADRVAAHPRDALHAAANIVEAVLGELISAWALTPPSKRTLSTLWATVKPALNADPTTFSNPNFKKIAGAMAATVDGLHERRDMMSRAHALPPDVARSYAIQPRHARLAVNSALGLTVFILEAWQAADERRAAA